ncbi:MAG: hypothetical protein II975_04935 [Bacteroidales bacterium]|jgi:hypothetical protein|nr:hypothetical protein [Bacteroidales bacterium]
MQFRISYLEIQSLIYRKTDKSILFSYDSPHSVRVGYDVTVLFKSTTVGLDITVERVDNTAVYLSYGGGMGIQFMVKQALEHAKNQPGADMLEAVDDNGLIFHLDKNPQLQQLLEHITLQDIRFDEHDVIIEFTAKTV